jgi:hypothetical protein
MTYGTEERLNKRPSFDLSLILDAPQLNLFLEVYKGIIELVKEYENQLLTKE